MTSDSYKIIDTNGNSVKLDKSESECKLSNQQMELLSHSRKCFDHCKQLEKAIQQINCSTNDDGLGMGTYFPLIIGRRPTLTVQKCPDNKQANT